MTNNILTPPPPFDPHVQSSTRNNIASQDAEFSGYDARSDEPQNLASAGRGEYTVTMDHHRTTWWTLRIVSRSINPRSLPTFIEGDPITGTVEVDLQRPDRIEAIVILVRGLIVYSAYDSKAFVEVRRTIWPSPARHSHAALRHNELPPGQYSWPFSISLPKEIQLSKKEANDYGLLFKGKLPPNLEDGSHANINYQIMLRIKRSGLFHHNSKLTTLFGYVPITRPDPPSRFRALAYESDLPVMGPDGDPEGWKIFPGVHLDGTLFKAATACLSISLALPTPLAYPRGMAFPCALILTSSNKQVIHLLSSPTIFVVEVHRKLQTAVGESIEGAPLVFTEDDRLPLTKANWHSAEVRETNGVCTSMMLGELCLPPNLVPSFTLGKFVCEYVVDVYPPATAGFEPASDERLFRTGITVTSMLAPGPMPRAYLPPGYLAPARRS